MVVVGIGYFCDQALDEPRYVLVHTYVFPSVYGVVPGVATHIPSNSSLLSSPSTWKMLHVMFQSKGLGEEAGNKVKWAVDMPLNKSRPSLSSKLKIDYDFAHIIMTMCLSISFHVSSI